VSVAFAMGVLVASAVAAGKSTGVHAAPNQLNNTNPSIILVLMFLIRYSIPHSVFDTAVPPKEESPVYNKNIPGQVLHCSSCYRLAVPFGYPADLP